MNPIYITRGDTVTLSYQLLEDGVAKDITGMSFKLAVKEKLTDTAFKIAAVDGTIVVAAPGKFSFTLTDTETDQTPFAGKVEIAMYDGSGNKTTLTPSGAVKFCVIEKILQDL